MIKRKKKNYKDIVLHGYPIRIFKDKVIILDKDKLGVDVFKTKAMQLARYLLDEAFIDKNEMKVIIKHSL